VPPTSPGEPAYRRGSAAPGTSAARWGARIGGHEPRDRPPPAPAPRVAMSTRTLLILAAITGVAILTAGAVQILLAR